MKKIFYLFCVAVVSASCVTQAKYNEVLESEANLYAQAQECDKELNKAKAKIQDLETLVAKLNQEKVMECRVSFSNYYFHEKFEGNVNSFLNYIKDEKEKKEVSKKEEAKVHLFYFCN